MASGTSRKTELKLDGVARASLEELLQDFEDFLRQHGWQKWGKDDPRKRAIRSLAWAHERTYKTYRTYVEEDNAETAANCLICLINQTNYLLDQQLRHLDRCFLEEGGMTERLYRMRRERR
jgi:four helix bundle suffix protein